MQELIKITSKEGKQLVNARELHEFLENKRKFSDWIKQRIEQYGFVENEDFTIHKFVNGKATQVDYAITVEMAKELSMVENNEKGSQARKYFIQCEKELRENVQALNTSQLSPELQMFNKMFQALANNELEQKKLKADIDSAKDELQGIRDAVLLNPSSWRKDTASIISKIAIKLGGFDHIKDVREESYKLLNETYKVNIKQRLVNKQKNMALEGCSKSKIGKVNYLDVIAEDEKLINGYIGIISKMAIKYGAI